MTILLFLAVLFVLILVHEWGHFIVAKKTGMRVDEFGIGFPPKLWGVKKGETEYTLNALPIGGFVRIWGENGEEPFSPVGSEASDRRSEASAEAGEGGTKSVSDSNKLTTARLDVSPVGSEASEGVMQPIDFSRSFSHRPKWAQALVLIAGVTMNVIFAWFLFSVTYMIGVPTAVDESTATETAQLYVASVLPNSPAEQLPPGAIINTVGYGDTVIEKPTPSEFIDVVSNTAPEPLTISYTFGGDDVTTSLVPVKGLVEDDPELYIVGLSLSLFDIERQSFFAAIGSGLVDTWNGLTAICVGLWTLISQAVVGEADLSQVAGPIGIVNMVGDAASFGLTALLTFTAFISLNLAIINLLPVPALDGGRLMFVAIESVTKRPIPPEWVGRVNLAGFAALMLLMIVVTYNDIVRLL